MWQLFTVNVKGSGACEQLEGHFLEVPRRISLMRILGPLPNR